MRAFLFFLDYMLSSGGVMPNPWTSFSDIFAGGNYYLFPDVGRAQLMIAWLNEHGIDYSVEFDLQNFGHATQESVYAYNTMEFFVRTARYEDLVLLKLAFNDVEIVE